MLQKLLASPIHAVSLAVFVAGISAIMFTRGLTEILFSDTSPYIMLGLALILICLMPILALKSFPDPKFFIVFGIGIALMGYGYIGG